MKHKDKVNNLTFFSCIELKVAKEYYNMLQNILAFIMYCLAILFRYLQNLSHTDFGERNHARIFAKQDCFVDNVYVPYSVEHCRYDWRNIGGFFCESYDILDETKWR